MQRRATLHFSSGARAAHFLATPQTPSEALRLPSGDDARGDDARRAFPSRGSHRGRSDLWPSAFRAADAVFCQAAAQGTRRK